MIISASQSSLLLDDLTERPLNLLAVTFYDHFLALNDERTYIWGRKLSGATLIYYVNRYLLLFEAVLLCSSFAVDSDLVS